MAAAPSEMVAAGEGEFIDLEADVLPPPPPPPHMPLPGQSVSNLAFNVKSIIQCESIIQCFINLPIFIFSCPVMRMDDNGYLWYLMGGAWGVEVAGNIAGNDGLSICWLVIL